MSLFSARGLCAILILPTIFGGCAFPLRPAASATRDRAFISYQPPALQTGKLRLAVKDNIDLKGAVTTAGSQRLTAENSPASRDATCMTLARKANVQIVGKTNMTEFALGTSGMNEFYGTPVNPLDHRRIPGGSSSGSAVAVANDEADVAFGSDTAGSIRVPAACCGIFGLKTTYGLVPLDGVFPLSPRNLDTIGPMAKDVPRLAKGMELLSAEFSARYQAAQVAKPSAEQIRIGRLYLKGTDPKIDRAVDAALKRAGFQVIKLDDQFKASWEKAQTQGATVAVSDGWLSDRSYAGKLGVGTTTSATIRLGLLPFNTLYARALEGRSVWRQTLEREFRRVNFIALPTLQSLPPRKPVLFGRTAVLEALVLAQQNTVAVNFAGNPAIAIPVPLEGSGFPVTSLQLIGPRNAEAQLVNAARLTVR